jgi:hypothetical protein
MMQQVERASLGPAAGAVCTMLLQVLLQHPAAIVSCKLMSTLHVSLLPLQSLCYTESNLNTSAVTGQIGRPGA